MTANLDDSVTEGVLKCLRDTTFADMVQTGHQFIECCFSHPVQLGDDAFGDLDGIVDRVENLCDPLLLLQWWH